jgi:hypothetical protein
VYLRTSKLQNTPRIDSLIFEKDSARTPPSSRAREEAGSRFSPDDEILWGLWVLYDLFVLCGDHPFHCPAAISAWKASSTSPGCNPGYAGAGGEWRMVNGEWRMAGAAGECHLL